jgi:nitrous oxide reductase accessory protein NosL
MKNAAHLLLISVFLFLNACTGSNHNDNNQSTENQRCAQCGMPTEEFQVWRGKIVTTAATKHFCSPRCLFINSQAHRIAPTDSIFVTDYYEQTLIDGRKAYYVTGSDVIGPMGHDLIPLASQQAAEDFMKEHKGQQLLTFDQINAETIRQLGKHHSQNM